MIKVFIDSSVFISAAFSATGASREIILMAIRDKISLIASPLVLAETEKNLSRKAAQALPAFRRFLDTLPLELSESTKQEVEQAATYTEIKDAPIVAAAIKAKVDYLVSLDKRHLVGVEAVTRGSGLQIVLPSDFLTTFRALS